MKIVIAPDSFKGSVSSTLAAEAMERGIKSVVPDAVTVKIPIADGGEGTLDAILTATRGEYHPVTVHGPLGETVQSAIGLVDGGSTAVIEMALAAGLGLVPPDRRDPRYTSTYGVGEIIESAVRAGARKIIIGIGGSSTNDGGAGAMQALGAKFISADGAEMREPICGADLSLLSKIDLSEFRFPNGDIEVVIASDVTNPLVGPRGATAVYGPQKGASLAIVEELEIALTNYAAVISSDLGVEVADRPGAGAAGGLGAALVAFLGARMASGIELLLDLSRFDEQVSDADYVLTGEGRIDAQTAQGKVVSGILSRCKLRGIPVIAFGGSVDPTAELQLTQDGLLAAVPIVNRCMSLPEAIDSGAELLEAASARTMRLLTNKHRV